MDASERERYSRQILFSGIGEDGQERLLRAHAVVVGCGALGSFQAGALARAGVGRLTIVDRDYVEPSNLHRQWLFEEEDAAAGLPKAAAAARRIGADQLVDRGAGGGGGSERRKRGRSAGGRGRDSGRHGQLRDALPGERLGGAGAHSLDLRRRGGFLRADHAGDTGPDSVPAVRVSRTAGGRAAHLRNGGGVERCGGGDSGDTGGGCAARAVRAGGRGAGAHHHGRCMVGNDAAGGGTGSRPGMSRPADGASFRFWSVREGRRRFCAAGTRCRFRSGRERSISRNWGRRLEGLGEVRANEFALRFRAEPYEMTIFADGRAIVKGTSDTGVARSLYARYVGG